MPEQLAPQPTVASRIHVSLGNMNASDAKVARTILERGEELGEWSITDLAREAGTATSTVSRACQTMGFAGFHELRLAVVRDAALDANLPTNDQELGPDTPVDDVLSRICEVNGAAIGRITQTVDPDAFAAAVGLLCRAEGVVVAGIGTSAAPAQEAAFRLTTLGVDASAPSDLIARRLAVHRLDANDLLMAISVSGRSRETYELAELAHGNGVPVIGMTAHAAAPIVGVSTAALVAGGPEIGFRLEAMASRIAHVTLLDALYLAVALRLGDRAMESLETMERAGSATTL